jgi:hypothetical protein
MTINENSRGKFIGTKVYFLLCVIYLVIKEKVCLLTDQMKCKCREIMRRYFECSVLQIKIKNCFIGNVVNKMANPLEIKPLEG